MRWEFDPLDDPNLASAEALQQIAHDLNRIADAVEDPDDPLRTDGGEDLPEFEDLLDDEPADDDFTHPAECTHPPDAIEAYGDYYPDGWVCTKCGHDLDGWELAERFPDHPLNKEVRTDGGGDYHRLREAIKQGRLFVDEAEDLSRNEFADLDAALDILEAFAEKRGVELPPMEGMAES